MVHSWAETQTWKRVTGGSPFSGRTRHAVSATAAAGAATHTGSERSGGSGPASA